MRPAAEISAVDVGPAGELAPADGLGYPKTCGCGGRIFTPEMESKHRCPPDCRVFSRCPLCGKWIVSWRREARALMDAHLEVAHAATRAPARRKLAGEVVRVDGSAAAVRPASLYRTRNRARRRCTSSACGARSSPAVFRSPDPSIIGHGVARLPIKSTTTAGVSSSSSS